MRPKRLQTYYEAKLKYHNVMNMFLRNIRVYLFGHNQTRSPAIVQQS